MEWTTANIETDCRHCKLLIQQFFVPKTYVDVNGTYFLQNYSDIWYPKQQFLPKLYILDFECCPDSETNCLLWVCECCKVKAVISIWIGVLSPRPSFQKKNPAKHSLLCDRQQEQISIMTRSITFSSWIWTCLVSIELKNASVPIQRGATQPPNKLLYRWTHLKNNL